MSELLDGGLFISTDLTLSDKAVSSFLSQSDVIDNLFVWVDRATGLNYGAAS